MSKQDSEYVELHWMEGYKLDVDVDGYKKMGWDKKYSFIAQSSTKRYYNCLFLLCKLSPCGRNLIDYLTEIMDKENIASTVEAERIKFREFMSSLSNGVVDYSDSAVKKAFQELKVKRLITSVSMSVIRINPLYFFKGSNASRIKQIKVTIKANSSDDLIDFKWIGQEVIKNDRIIKHRAGAKKDMENNRKTNI